MAFMWGCHNFVGVRLARPSLMTDLLAIKHMALLNNINDVISQKKCQTTGSHIITSSPGTSYRSVYEVRTKSPPPR